MFLKIADQKLLIGLFCLFWILVIGSYGVFSDIGFAIDANERLAKAERVPAVITKVDTNERSVTDGKLFTPWVSYKFSYKGNIAQNPGSCMTSGRQPYTPEKTQRTC